MLPPRSQRLVEATPFHELESGTKACIEFTIYRDGHAGISVSRIEGKPPSRRIVQGDSLPLNSVPELREHVLAVIDHVAGNAQTTQPEEGGAPSADADQQPDTTLGRWSIDGLRGELESFEQELRSARLEESSIRTYVDRSATFLRWLTGDYHPRRQG